MKLLLSFSLFWIDPSLKGSTNPSWHRKTEWHEYTSGSEIAINFTAFFWRKETPSPLFFAWTTISSYCCLCFWASSAGFAGRFLKLKKKKQYFKLLCPSRDNSRHFKKKTYNAARCQNIWLRSSPTDSWKDFFCQSQRKRRKEHLNSYEYFYTQNLLSNFLLFGNFSIFIIKPTEPTD